MASRNFHKRRTRERKARQAEQHRMAFLRERAIGLEGMTPRMVATMSKAALLRRVRRGGRVRMVTPMDGVAIAMALAAHAPKMFVRDGKRMPFENL